MNDQPLISEFADDADMRELIEMFSESLETTVSQLPKLLAAGDVESIRRQGHQLKGAGGGYGYPAITDAGALVEAAARRSNRVDGPLTDAVTQLVQLCERARLGIALLHR